MGTRNNNPPLAVREPVAARPVLVRFAGGIWSGLLHRWQRHSTGWHGAVTWDMMGQPHQGLVAAPDLRPYESDRTVEVQNVFDAWEPGLLLSWRRRAGVRYWEIEVRLGDDAYRGIIDWFPAARVRAREGTAYSDAF